MSSFRFGHAAADSWQRAADSCLAQIGAVPRTANLGFLYLTDDLGEALPAILDRFRQSTGVEQWVGAVGIGICATGAEYYQGPAIAAMLAELPDDEFRVFPNVVKDLNGFDERNADWIRAHDPYLALVHADPANGLTEALVSQLATRTSAGFLVGGLASSRDTAFGIANGVTQGGVSGVLFSPRVGIVTRLSQGCSPIGPQRTVTEARRNILISLDGEPALEALKTDVGEVLARDLARIGGYIFAGLPIQGSDTGDYLVRNLIGIDADQGLVAVGDLIESGRKLVFCRRDPNTARDDLDRMLDAIGARLPGRPRGGVYVSCLGRGASLFGPDSAELKQIRSRLGEFPLVGFYANGEISRDRLYGYTGVLTLFT